MKLTTQLSTPWGWKAELALLADLQRMVYPYKWLPISCKSGADQWKFAGQRPTFYHWATKPTETTLMLSISVWLTIPCQKYDTDGKPPPRAWNKEKEDESSGNHVLLPPSAWIHEILQPRFRLQNKGLCHRTTTFHLVSPTHGSSELITYCMCSLINQDIISDANEICLKW